MWTRFSRPEKGAKNRSLQFAHKRVTFVQTCANLTRHCLPSSRCGSRRSRPVHPLVRPLLAKRVFVLHIDMHVVYPCRGRRLTLTDQTPSLSVRADPHPATLHAQPPTTQFRHKFSTFTENRRRFFLFLLPTWVFQLSQIYLNTAWNLWLTNWIWKLSNIFCSIFKTYRPRVTQYCRYFWALFLLKETLVRMKVHQEEEPQKAFRI